MATAAAKAGTDTAAQREIAELRRQLAAKDEIVTALRGRLAQCQEENQRMRRYIGWEGQIFALPNVSATDKLVLRAARSEQELAREKRGEEVPGADAEGAEDETETVYLPNLAKRCGVSPKTASASISRWGQLGGVKREVRYHTSEATGEKIKRLSLALTVKALEMPRSLAPDDDRGQGGRPDRGVTCAECGSERLIVRRTVTCFDCGTVLSDTTKPLNKTAAETAPVAPEEGAAPDFNPYSQLGSTVDVQPVGTGAALFSDDEPAPQVCSATVDGKHRYAELRTADYRRICVYCDEPEEHPFETLKQQQQTAKQRGSSNHHGSTADGETVAYFSGGAFGG